MAYILHIDTSSEKATIAISHNGKCLHQKINEDARNHAATINLLIDEVLAQSNVELRTLNAICVIGGPGSYTGLRIGLATAKGLCYVLDLPLILINKLEMLALQYQRMYCEHYNHYLTKLTARTQEYFISLYNKEGEQLLTPQHITEEALQNLVTQYSDGLAIIGQRLSEQMPADNDITYYEDEQIDVDFWSAYALELFNCNSFVNLATSEPFYLKQVYTHNKL